MTIRLAQPVKSAWLSERLGLELIGPDRPIDRICRLDRLEASGLSFALAGRAPADGTTGVIFASEAPSQAPVTVIRSSKPRLDFIRAQYLLESTPGFLAAAAPPQLHPTVKVGPNCVIDADVTIGEGTVLGSGVVVRPGTRIGRRCLIKSGTVIGESGFGFERDERGRPLRMIHLGGVRIGDFVEIGSLNTICRGALDDTVLESYVKTDDHVHIAHNCRVGEGAMLTACAELSGSVTVGRNAWLAPNCSVMQKLTLGDGCFVGIGSVVARDVEPGEKVFGVPARRVAGG